MAATAAAALAARPAAAQSFPATSAYVPFRCGGQPMFDAAGDTPGATGALDVVGSAANPLLPAAARTGDVNYLYLRLRLAADPRSGGHLVADGWGWEFDTDGDRTTYEVLIAAGGVGGIDSVELFRNRVTTRADSPADPADEPPAQSYSNANLRVSPAESALGGGQDFYLDVAVPWLDLAPLGITPSTHVAVWAGSSTRQDALDLDLACFGGAGARLSGIEIGGDVDATVSGGSVGGGGSGGGVKTRTLEGGIGCSVGGGGAGAPGLWGLVGVGVVLALRRGRRRGLPAR